MEQNILRYLIQLRVFDILALFTVMLLTGNANAQRSYICKTANGTVLQQFPCEVGIAGDEIKRREEAHTKMQQEKRALDQQRLEEAALRAKKCGGKPVVSSPEVGMTEVQFLNCTSMGIDRYWTVNETETERVRHRQYVMDGSSGIKYVYTRNGVVTSIQR